MRTRIWHSDWKPRWLIRCVSAALLSFMDKQVVKCDKLRHTSPTSQNRTVVMSRKSNLKRFNRLSRRTFLAVALIAALIGAVGGQRAAASDDPAVAFVQGVGNDVIAILGDKANSTLAEREAAFRDMMGRGFDIPTVTRFVLGRHWKSATNEQRAEFSAIFLDFIARVYASRFDSYSYGGEQFTVRSVIADESGDTIVQATVARPSGADPVALDFRVRSKDGNHRVVDLYVEGISMLLTHRAEFSSVINRKGIDGLLSEIRARIEAPLEDPAE